jgi:hypothetical protein
MTIQELYDRASELGATDEPLGVAVDVPTNTASIYVTDTLTDEIGVLVDLKQTSHDAHRFFYTQITNVE